MSDKPPEGPIELDERPHWTLDRRVPITLIVGLVVQTAGMVWYLRGLVEVQVQHGQRLERLEGRVVADRVAERLAVLEYQQTEMRQLLVRIDSKLGR